MCSLVTVSSLQRLANSIYRQVGRASARVLGTSEIVESVFIHRSVATDEVAFGRSDIDLLVMVRQPVSESCDGPELASLSTKARWMHSLTPVVGQMEVHDPWGLQRWFRTDPYRASIERRSAIQVYGQPLEFTSRPIQTEHAVRRMLVCLHTFLSVAVRQRNQRNLRKFALDAWNAYATAAHLIAEPYLSRREAEAHCRAEEAEALPDDPDQALRLFFQTVERLHHRLLRPLKRIQQPVIFRAQLPPGFQQRTFVVLPDAASTLPAEAFGPSTFLCTPEAFDLYVQYTNAFLYWAIPPELVRLGISAPGIEAFVRSCRYFCDPHKIRYPIFMKTRDIRPAIGRVATLRHAVEHLCRGRIPPPLGPEEMREALARPPACSDYYRSVFPRLYWETERLWEKLQELPELASQRRASSA